MTGFPFFGFGLGIRTEYYEHYLEQKPKNIDWGEVITESFLPWSKGEPARSLANLLKIRAHIPIALHGVSMSIGSSEGIDKTYLKHLKALASIVEPAWVSDHLCWTSFKKHNAHDLLPLPFTREAVNHISNKISKTQDYLGKTILIENVSAYLEFEESEMTEWEFINAILKKSGCGLLLDVNNVYVSSVNQKFDPITYLKSIPKDKVGQIHLAGHSDHDYYKVDTHDAPICKEVWDLYRWTAKHFGPISVMIERDDEFPPWEELVSELLKVKEFWIQENGTRKPYEITAAV